MQMKVSKKLLLPDWAERRERAFNSTSSISTTRPNAPFLAQLTLPDYFNLQALVTEQQNKKEKKAQTEESPTNKMTRKRHACFRNTQDFGPKKKRNTQDFDPKKQKETHKMNWTILKWKVKKLNQTKQILLYFSVFCFLGEGGSGLLSSFSHSAFS